MVSGRRLGAPDGRFIFILLAFPLLIFFNSLHLPSMSLPLPEGSWDKQVLWTLAGEFLEPIGGKKQASQLSLLVSVYVMP